MSPVVTESTIIPPNEASSAPAASGALLAPEPPFEVDAPYLFSSELFLRMVENDVFPEGDRVYLWEGRVVQKMAKNRPHGISNGKFLDAFRQILPPGWHVNTEDTVIAGPGKLPLPDVMIVRGVPDDYPLENPSASDVGLVVELAHTSLKRDLGPKMRGYASAGFPAYWVADLVGGKIIEHRDPVPDEARYATVLVHERGGALNLILDDVVIGPIPVAELLPNR